MIPSPSAARSDVEPGRAPTLPPWTAPEYTVISTALEMTMYAGTASDHDDA